MRVHSNMESIVCPHCGNTEQFFMKRVWRNVEVLYDNNGILDNENYDRAYPEDGQLLYCCNCGKRVIKISALENNEVFQ